MTTTLLIAALLAQPECRAGRAELNIIAPLIIRASRKHGIPSSLLAATILAETGVSNLIAYGRGKERHGADVGYAQVHVPNWDKNIDLVRLYSQPGPNLHRAAYLLHYKQKVCKKLRLRRCRRCPWCLYNPGSKTWCKKVLKFKRRLERYIKCTS